MSVKFIAMSFKEKEIQMAGSLQSDRPADEGGSEKRTNLLLNDINEMCLSIPPSYSSLYDTCFFLAKAQ